APSALKLTGPAAILEAARPTTVGEIAPAIEALAARLLLLVGPGGIAAGVLPAAQSLPLPALVTASVDLPVGARIVIATAAIVRAGLAGACIGHGGLARDPRTSRGGCLRGHRTAAGGRYRALGACLACVGLVVVALASLDIAARAIRRCEGAIGVCL